MVSIFVNLILTLCKLLAGILGHSEAMISDAIHSASDVFSTFVVIAGVRMAEKKADKEHPYGHERMECVASIILAIMLGIVGVGIGMSGLQKILSGSYEDLTVPGRLPLVMAIVSIGVKEWMFHYSKSAAIKINSGALMADAWHHRSDALSSVGALVGILFARFGYPIMDSVASVIICVCILKAALDVFKDGLDKMVDHSCDEETEQKIRSTAEAVDGVLGIDDLKTRLFGSKLYVDMEILVDGEQTLKKAHRIAEQVHHRIEQEFPQCKHCMVHENPME
jgi:cation diffusion facilitator family transporter